MNTKTSSNADYSQWSVDLIHSELSFQTKYLMIGTVTGHLTSFNLEVETSGNDFGEVTYLQLTADLTSLTTRHEPRDEHLKSHDFFDVENHPHLTFQGMRFEKQGMLPPSILSAYRRDFKLQGNLVIKGISRSITLDGEFGGMSTDKDGQKRAGFTVRSKISRNEFGLMWQSVLGSDKLILADEVDIIANIQLVKQIADNAIHIGMP
jgi:polyisoprenoid-binding protein YceI